MQPLNEKVCNALEERGENPSSRLFREFSGFVSFLPLESETISLSGGDLSVRNREDKIVLAVVKFRI